MTVLASERYATNANLIVAAHELGYLTDDALTLDPTFGLGVFWRLWRPTHLVASDLDLEKSPLGVSVDFTDLPWHDGAFAAVVLDPPYKLNGTPSAPDERYGVGEPTDWRARIALCERGIDECARVCAKDGHLLIKCMDQVVSGAKRWQTRIFTDRAEAAGCRLVDRLDMLVTPRPQPPGRRQVHSLGNYSTLLVLRKTTP